MTMTLSEVLRKSETRMIDLHPYVRYLTIQLITESYVAGVPIIITQGFRSIAYQDALYAQGRTVPGQIVTKAKGGRSFHCYGLAVDFALLLPDGKSPSWDTVRDGDSDGHKDWYEVAAIGKKIGFEWGGDWDRFIDLPHFQYTFGLTIDELQQKKKTPTLAPEAANKIISEELGPAWKVAKEKGDPITMEKTHKLANELRVASGQEPQK